MFSVKGRKLYIDINFSIPLPYKYRGGGAAVFRLNNGKPEVLLGLRAHSPGRGLWSFPGGGTEGKEKLSSAGVREFKEETGVQLYSRYITRTGVFQIKKHFFEWETVIIETTQNIGFSFKLNSRYEEFISLKWVPLSELDNYKLHIWVKNTVGVYLSGKMKRYTPKKANNALKPPDFKNKKIYRDNGVNYLFDMAEMVLTKADTDGTKYFNPRYPKYGRPTAVQEALYGV